MPNVAVAADVEAKRNGDLGWDVPSAATAPDPELDYVAAVAKVALAAVLAGVEPFAPARDERGLVRGGSALDSAGGDMGVAE